MAESATEIPSPLLSFARAMGDTDGKWQLRGEYAIWAGSRKEDEPYLLHEWRDKRVVPIRRSSARPVMHRILGGVPFEVAHLFGFWITVDVDTVWIDAGEDAKRCAALIVGGTKGKPAKAECGWVCPKCGEIFNRAVFAIPHQHFERFLDFADERVRAFNADAALRKCPQCNAIHPPSYGFDAHRDGDIERTARQEA